MAELEWLRAHVPQAFDRFDLFDPNRASHLVRHGLVPAYAVSTLNDRIQREANATYRPVPDLFDRRLAYQPGPGAMSGLDRRNVNMGSAGGAMRSVSVPRPEASSYRPQSSSSRAVVPSFSAPAPNRPSARPGPTSDRPWTEADTDLLFRLRAQHVGFKDCAVSDFPETPNPSSSTTNFTTKAMKLFLNHSTSKNILQSLSRLGISLCLAGFFCDS